MGELFLRLTSVESHQKRLKKSFTKYKTKKKIKEQATFIQPEKICKHQELSNLLLLTWIQCLVNLLIKEIPWNLKNLIITCGHLIKANNYWLSHQQSIMEKMRLVQVGWDKVNLEMKQLRMYHEKNMPLNKNIVEILKISRLRNVDNKIISIIFSVWRMNWEIMAAKAAVLIMK